MTEEPCNVDLIFIAFPIRGLEQKVTWLSGWANIPWVGLDTSACKYLDGNCTRQGGETLTLTYPVKILSFYPAVSREWFESEIPNSTHLIYTELLNINHTVFITIQGLYPIRWEFYADNPNGGSKISLGCILTKIRITA